MRTICQPDRQGTLRHIQHVPIPRVKFASELNGRGRNRRRQRERLGSFRQSQRIHPTLSDGAPNPGQPSPGAARDTTVRLPLPRSPARPRRQRQTAQAEAPLLHGRFHGEQSIPTLGPTGSRHRRTQWFAPHRRTFRGRKSCTGSHTACARTTAGGFGFDPLPQRLPGKLCESQIHNLGNPLSIQLDRIAL